MKWEVTENRKKTATLKEECRLGGLETQHSTQSVKVGTLRSTGFRTWLASTFPISVTLRNMSVAISASTSYSEGYGSILSEVLSAFPQSH